MNSLHHAVRIVNSTALTFGVKDALNGEYACPEMFFSTTADKCDYCRGFESVAGPTLTTQQFLGLTGDAHIEDTLDLEDAIIETEYLRSWH